MNVQFFPQCLIQKREAISLKGKILRHDSKKTTSQSQLHLLKCTLRNKRIKINSTFARIGFYFCSCYSYYCFLHYYFSCNVLYVYIFLCYFHKNIKLKGNDQTRGVQYFIILDKAHYHILFVNLLKS